MSPIKKSCFDISLAKTIQQLFCVNRVGTVIKCQCHLLSPLIRPSSPETGITSVSPFPDPPQVTGSPGFSYCFRSEKTSRLCPIQTTAVQTVSKVYHSCCHPDSHKKQQDHFLFHQHRPRWHYYLVYEAGGKNLPFIGVCRHLIIIIKNFHVSYWKRAYTVQYIPLFLTEPQHLQSAVPSCFPISFIRLVFRYTLPKNVSCRKYIDNYMRILFVSSNGRCLGLHKKKLLYEEGSCSVHCKPPYPFSTDMP